MPSLWYTLAYKFSSSRPLAELRPGITSLLPSLLAFALGSFLFGSTVGQLGSSPVTFYSTLQNTLPSKLQHVKCCTKASASLEQHSPGDVEVVEKLSLGEAFFQEAVGLFGSHLGHCMAAFSRRHIWPLHQTAYTSHAATGREGQRVTEVFVGATGQRKSLD